MAIDEQAVNQAERLGFSRLTGSMIPSTMDFALRIEPLPYDPTHAKRLLADAGYPNGFDAGDLTPLPPFATFGEAAANYLGAVGIRTRVRSMERATFMEAWRAKQLPGGIPTGSAAPAKAPARIGAFALSTAPAPPGGHPAVHERSQHHAPE